METVDIRINGFLSTVSFADNLSANFIEDVDIVTLFIKRVVINIELTVYSWVVHRSRIFSRDLRSL